MQRNTIQRKYFRTPFCAEYWRQAFSELKNTRTLVFAALILALRILRVFRLFRYSKNLRIIANVFQKQKHAFLMVLLLMLVKH